MDINTLAARDTLLLLGGHGATHIDPNLDRLVDGQIVDFSEGFKL